MLQYSDSFQTSWFSCIYLYWRTLALFILRYLGQATCCLWIL